MILKIFCKHFTRAVNACNEFSIAFYTMFLQEKIIVNFKNLECINVTAAFREKTQKIHFITVSWRFPSIILRILRWMNTFSTVLVVINVTMLRKIIILRTNSLEIIRFPIPYCWVLSRMMASTSFQVFGLNLRPCDQKVSTRPLGH